MESNKSSRFDNCSRQEECIDHIPYNLSGLSRAFFSTTSLEIADKNKQTNKQNKNKEKKTVPFSDSLFF